MRIKNAILKFLSLGSDLFLLISALAAILFGIFEFFSASDYFSNNKLLAIISGLLGLVLLALLIDRRIELAGIKKILEVKVEFEYLTETEDVVKELKNLVKNANEFHIKYFYDGEEWSYAKGPIHEFKYMKFIGII